MNLSGHKYSHLSDNELLNLYYAKRDNHWLGILLPRYTLLLLGVCMKYLKNEQDAQDAVQQIFLKVINELEKYEVTYFKSWIFMIAKNHCLMALRKNKYNQVEVNENVLKEQVSEEANETKIKEETLLTLMEEALNQLNEEQRKCIELFYLQKKSYADIAEITGYSMLQVKSHLQNGKRNLKQLIETQQKKQFK